MREEWRELPWGPYLVSNLGRVAFIRHRMAGPNESYVRCHSRMHGGGFRPTYAHQLVAEVFIGPKPPGCDIHHKNGDKHDNRAANLEYVTRKDHVAISSRNGQVPHGERHGSARLTEDAVRDIRRRFKPYKVTRDQLAREYGVSGTTIQSVVERRTWKHVE